MRILTDGLIASLPFAVVVWISFLTMPRLWLHSLPDDIQGMAAPKTPRERRLTGIMGVFVLLTFFGLPIFLTWQLKVEMGGALPFGAVMGHLYGVWFIVNLWDLVLIDWVYIALVNPEKPPIPNTAGAAGYKDYRFHFNSFLKACVLSLIILIPAAVIITLA